MARNEQLIRHHKILQLLEGLRYGATLDELAARVKDELGLSSLHQRTVRRDIEALQVAGFDIQPEDSPRGRVWKVGATFRNGFKVNASTTELIALSVAREMLMPLHGTPFWQGIESFWSKLMDEVPPSIASHYERHRDTLFVLGTIPKDYSDKLGVLKTLQRGIHEHRVIEIVYRAPGKEASTRMVEPYATIVYVSSIYVVAADAELTDSVSRLRHWKLDRVEKATAMDEWFTLPGDLDLGLGTSGPGSLFSSGPTVSYIIELSDSAAQRLREDPWHPDQKLQKESSGRWLLHVDAAHPLDILPRVLSLGSEAQLLEPLSVRNQLRQIVEDLHDKYKTDSGDPSPE